jgi:Na+-driven multidrug efflux pump
MVRLEKHVVYYGLFFTTTVGASLLYAQQFGKSDEEKAAFLVRVHILFLKIQICLFRFL